MMTKTKTEKTKKHRRSTRQIIAVCLALVMFFGSVFAYESAIALSEHRNLTLDNFELEREHNLDLDRTTLPADYAELVDLSDWHVEENELSELPPEILEALLREQEAYFALSSRVREKAIFLRLLSEGLRYSDLTEANRFFVFRQLDIACVANAITDELFREMEHDGFTLVESIELVRIMSGGFFDYEEAKMIFSNIPSTFERLTEVAYFEQFARMFDIAAQINARRLINMPFYSTKAFTERYILVEEKREEEAKEEDEIKDEEAKEEEAREEEAEDEIREEETTESPPIEESDDPSQSEETTDPPQADETTDLPQADENSSLPPEDSTLSLETDPPATDENSSNENGQYLITEEQFGVQQFSGFERAFAHLEDNPANIEDDLKGIEDGQVNHAENDQVNNAEEDQVNLENGQGNIEDDQVNNAEEDQKNQEDDPILEEKDDDTLTEKDSDDYTKKDDEKEQEEEAPERYTEENYSLMMLTHADAFDFARQMFLNNRRTAEIEAAFTYGEVLRSDSQVNLQQQDGYRTQLQDGYRVQLQRRFANYTSEEALANILFADVFFTSEDPYARYLGKLMFPEFETRLADTLAYADVDEYGNIIDYDADTLDYDAYQAITPMSTVEHGDIVNNPFALRFNASESVSLNTGASMYRVNIVSLPGRNGFNLNLDMVYSSSRAYSNGHGAISIFRNLHGLGEGWIFDLPHIWNNVLYVPGRGSFALNGNQIQEYTLHDMQLFNDTTFLSGTIRSDRRLTFHNGTSYFFNGAHIIGMVDRFNNTIRFEYANVLAFNNLRLLSRIVDTNGRIITFTYASTPASGNQAESRTVTVTSPDGGTFVINMWQSERLLLPNVFLVSTIRNQVGAVTMFGYSDQSIDLHFSNKNPSASGFRRDTVWLLSRVTYPSLGQLRFEYSQTTINLGRDGSRHLWRVARRELYTGGQVFLRTTFGYEGDHTAFPQHVTTPPENHTYRTTVTQNNGLRTVYTFNNRHLNTLQRTYNASGTLFAEQIITYNNDRLPTSIETTEHRGNLSRVNTQQFTYNRYGQITQIVSPLARGSTLARYRTDYTFDARFGLLLTRTSRPNATTTIVERNTLSSDGRSIVREYIYENNVRRARMDFTHDAFGNITEIREFYANTANAFTQTQITYNSGTMPSLIRRTGVRDANGTLVGNIDRQFTYDTMWRTLTETDPNGYITRFQYDRLGRITRITFPNGGFATYAYDDFWNTVTHRTVLGATYVYRYDGLGNLRSITANGVEILRNFRDNRMRIIETSKAQGINSSKRKVFTYDVFDRVNQRGNLSPAGVILTREEIVFSDVFDTAGNRRITTTVIGTGTAATGNAPNIQTFVQYDRFGRRTQEGTIGGRITTFTHDLAGRVITEQSLGVNNTFTYNVHGVTSVRNILGHTSQNTYDMMGRVVSSTDFMGNTQRFTYDHLSRRITHRVPFERSGTTVRYAETRYFYDRNSNVIRQSSLVNVPGQAQIWATTESTFRHNRLISSETGGANGIRTTYTYDLAGNVLTKTVGGATTTFAYNNRGQLIRTTDALGQSETFYYDENGNLITHIDRNGTTFRMTYNNLGQMTRREAVQNGVVVAFRSYSFHPTGALRTVDIGSHVMTYYYDAQGRVRRQTETGGIVKTFAYNTANNLTQSRVYINNVLQSNKTYTFDAAQRVETVAANGEILSTYTYNANGRRTSTDIYTGLRTTYTHNLAGLVTNVTNRRSNNLIISSFEYLYYLDGNTRQVAERLSGVARTTIFTYDLARRLIRESVTGFEDRTESFTFDNRGNRITRIVTGTENYTVAYTYDLNNRLLASTRTPAGGIAEVTTFTYDRNGNQLTKATRGVTETKTYNAFNQLIHIKTTTRYDLSHMIAANDSNIVMRHDGAVLTWGSNSSGQLGDGTLTTRNTPVQVQNITGGSAVAAGGNHTAALRDDDTVWAWGSNFNGQLGDGTTTTRHTPVQVQNLTDVTAISANSNRTFALRSDGILWAWGDNSRGQLGDGTTTTRHTPVQVQNLTDVRAVAAGVHHTVALRNDGTVWAWGNNPNGQLGDNSVTDRRTPVQVHNLEDVIAISAGNAHTVALRSDGTVWAWGHNLHYQLGDGTRTNRRTPVQVHNLEGIIAIAAGNNHNIALRDDGTVWAWGVNSQGNLGDATTTNRSTPVQVLGVNGFGFLNLFGESSLQALTPAALDDMSIDASSDTLSLIDNSCEHNSPISATVANDVVAELHLFEITFEYCIEAEIEATNSFTNYIHDSQLATLTDEFAETNSASGFNQLTSGLASGMIATYTYRADGLRRSKTVNGVTTTHIWNRGHIVLELNASGTIINRFDRSLNGRLIRSPQHGYYLHNARGDVVQRANVQTSVLRNYRYTAFGVELNPAANNRNPFRFASMYWDAEASTYYTPYRHFNPRTGRWTQPDPHWNIGNMMADTNAILQSGNLFMYTMHNPIRWIDPMGLAAQSTGGFRSARENFEAFVAWNREMGYILGSSAPPCFFTGRVGDRLSSSVQNIRFAFFSTAGNRARFEKAIAYLREGSEIANDLIRIIEAGGVRITVGFKHDDFATFTPHNRRILWDPFAGAQLPCGAVMSPAMVLAHELGHVAQYLNREFDRLLTLNPRTQQHADELARLEARNIEVWETPIADQLGEPTRASHDIGIIRMMNNPTHHRIIYTPGLDRTQSIIEDRNWR